MGMVNQLGKFVPGLDDISAPLQQLLRKDGAWYWDEAQQTAFQRIKEKLASPEILAHYNSNRKTVLPQMHHQQGLEQFYPAVPSDISRSLSELRGTMQSLKEKCVPQPGMGTVRPWTQVYPGNRSQATCSTPHYNQLVQDAPSNIALPAQPRGLERSW